MRYFITYTTVLCVTNSGTHFSLSRRRWCRVKKRVRIEVLRITGWCGRKLKFPLKSRALMSAQKHANRIEYPFEWNEMSKNWKIVLKSSRYMPLSYNTYKLWITSETGAHTEFLDPPSVIRVCYNTTQQQNQISSICELS